MDRWNRVSAYLWTFAFKTPFRYLARGSAHWYNHLCFNQNLRASKMIDLAIHLLYATRIAGHCFGHFLRYCGHHPVTQSITGIAMYSTPFRYQRCGCCPSKNRWYGREYDRPRELFDRGFAFYDPVVWVTWSVVETKEGPIIAFRPRYHSNHFILARWLKSCWCGRVLDDLEVIGYIGRCHCLQDG